MENNEYLNEDELNEILHDIRKCKYSKRGMCITVEDDEFKCDGTEKEKLNCSIHVSHSSIYLN